MSAPAWIDDLYRGFIGGLPAALASQAADLAVTLGLAPSRDVPWSEVFSNEITLAAPALIAEAMPALPVAAVRSATLAHMLAVIEAFGTDRIEDGQAPATEALAAVLAGARTARDEALSQVARDAGPAYARAERETLAAIRSEQELLRGGGAVRFDRYLAISHGKQRVGLPASLALARAAGWDERRVRCLARLLDAVWVALQLHDDVIDWEDDLARGGAWAVSLAGAGQERATAPVRRLVHVSGVLARLLAASARRFRAARRRAQVLGAARLAGWAGEREAVVGALARREAESPGFANRAHALSHWAKAVLT